MQTRARLRFQIVNRAQKFVRIFCFPKRPPNLTAVRALCLARATNRSGFPARVHLASGDPLC